MGQLVMGIAGGLIGSLFGMPQLGFLAGSLLGAVLFGGGNSKGGPKLNDLHVSSSTYGKPITWGWGTARIGGNVIQAGLLVQHKHQQGKGGATGGGGTSYTYSSTHAVGLCSTEFTGPIKNVLKIWADTKLVYDSTGQSGISQNIPGSGGGKGGGGHGNASAVVNGGISSAFNKVGVFRVYYGTQDQMPDPAMEALLPDPTDQVPYRGMAYVVFDDIDLSNYGNRVPNWTFEVSFANDGPALSQNSFYFNFLLGSVAYPSDNGVALDSFRQRAYFFRGGGSMPGIHSMSLATGDEVFSSTAARTFAPATYGSISNAADGCIIANDGYLWVWGGGANFGVLDKIDPDTLLVVGEIGTPNPFGSINGSVPLPTYTVPLTLDHTNYLLTSGLFHSIWLTDITNMGPSANASFTEGTMHICGGNMTGSGSATAIGIGCDSAFGGGSPDPFNLYVIDVVPGNLTFNLIQTYNPSDIDSDWANFIGVSTMIFDATDGNVMVWVSTNSSVGTNHFKTYLIKLNVQSGAIMWKMPYPPSTYGAAPGNPDYGSYQSIVASGIYSFIDGEGGGGHSAQVWTVDTQTGTPVINPWGGHLSAGYQAWADSFGAILFDGQFDPTGNGWSCLITNQAGQGKSVASIISDICTSVGFDPVNDLDLSAINTSCEGYILDQQMLAKDALMPLGVTFLFDGVESDYKIKYVPRGQSSIRNIPSTDLAYLDDKMNAIVNETRTQEVDLPNNVQLNFLDPTHNYQTATQYARRPAKPYPTMYSKAAMTENLPIVSSPGFMKQLAEKLLFTAWVERVSYKTHLPWTYLRYDPTDVLTLNLTDGTQIVTRMSTVNIGADMTMEWQALSQSSPTYSSIATTLGGQGFAQQLLSISTATRLFLLDMPLLRDSDDTGQAYTILYDTASGYGTSWAGANIDFSSDDVNFSAQAPIPATSGALWGSAINALPDVVNPFIIDNVNTLTLSMVNGGSSLASATLLEVCNGANAGVLQSATGEVEIIQWLNVTVNGDGTYTLSGLLRGRRGTDTMTGTHAIGDTFVVCNTTNMSSIKMTLADLNTNRYFRATTNGTATADANVQTFIDTGRSWKPYAPVQQAAATSGSDIALSWVRRTRFGGELAPFTGIVPLSEQAESYEVDIYDALGNTVLRTLRVDNGATPVTSPGALYTAAEIAADFGSTPTQLWIAVYQISTVIGRGFGKKILVQVT